MPDLEFFVVADSIAIDQRTDRISIFHVLDDLRPRRFPARVVRFTAVSTWLIADGEQDQDFQAILRVRGPIEGELSEHALNFTAQGRAQRTVHQLLGGPTITGPGLLEFELSLNNRVVAHHRTFIYEANPAEPPAGMLLYRPEQQADEPRRDGGDAEAGGQLAPNNR